MLCLKSGHQESLEVAVVSCELWGSYHLPALHPELFRSDISQALQLSLAPASEGIPSQWELSI